MKTLIQIFLLLFSTTFTFGQVISLKTEKTDYKIDETITLIYEIEAKVDSFDNLIGTNFKIINGPSKSSSASTKNGQTTFYTSITYDIKANSQGEVKIKSPTFYFDNQKQQTSDLTLNILDSNLSDNEVEELNFNEFKDNSIKPNGTLRIIFTDKHGYIEEFIDFQWVYKRKLTKKEIKKLIKK